MIRSLIIWMFLISSGVDAQVIVNLQLPPVGVLQKEQLWNMLLTNTGTSTLTVHMELNMSEAMTGQQVMGAVTKTFILAPGSQQMNAATFAPIQYTVLSSIYNIDPGPGGFLPIGRFTVCYSLMAHNQDAISKISEDCDDLQIDPLSPPQLVFPWDQTTIDTKLPQFSWLPPSPVNYFTNLRYDFDLVEISPSQSAGDAMQQNVPLLHLADVLGNNLLYPASSMALEYNKNYAWKITAKSNGAPISGSEIWSFTMQQFQKVDSIKFIGLPYSRLQKDVQAGYAIAVNSLKMEYNNETADSLWNISVYDLTASNLNPINIRWDTIPLKRGQNLVKINLNHLPDFLDQHFYLLELRNSRNETWRLKFEFRREEE